MSKRQKLIDRLKLRSRNFTFNEMETLLLSLGFRKSNKGRTSGSRVIFSRDSVDIGLHRPHPQKELEAYQIKKNLKLLESEDLI